MYIYILYIYYIYIYIIYIINIYIYIYLYNCSAPTMACSALDKYLLKLFFFNNVVDLEP